LQQVCFSDLPQRERTARGRLKRPLARVRAHARILSILQYQFLSMKILKDFLDKN
jgi:hypothetical protein